MIEDLKVEKALKKGSGSKFIDEIKDAINRCSMENGSNTPDFILARYLGNCLDAFVDATRQRDKWYLVHLEPGNCRYPYFTGEVKEP